MRPVALTIAGSDPSGGAGIQADLKTFHQRGVYGTSVVTLVTAQNTVRVTRVETLSPQLVAAQLNAVLEDIPPRAAKTGALGNRAIVDVIAQCARSFGFPLVVDPVMASQQGTSLLPADAAETLREELLPSALLVTPNLSEASALAGLLVKDLDTMEKAARRIAGFGVEAVLVKGGHLEGKAVDLLLWKDSITRFSAERIDTPHTHGTGCTLSAAIVAELAKGRDLLSAVRIAKQFVTRAIAGSTGLGKGRGPINHHATIDEDSD